MTDKKKSRGLWELNRFQLRVLLPFYAACVLTAIFFAVMCYIIFVYPQYIALAQWDLPECRDKVPTVVVISCAASLLFSVLAFIIVHRSNNRWFEQVFSAQPSAQTAAPADKPRIIPTILSGLAFVFAVVMTLFAAYQYFGLAKMFPDGKFLSQEVQPYQLVVVLAGFTVMFSIMALFYWAYDISHKILGPYERIVRELDHILESKASRTIKLRQGDEMFSQIMDRINILIEQRKIPSAPPDA